MVRQDDVVVRGRHSNRGRSRDQDPDVVQDRSVVDVPDPVPDEAELVLRGPVDLDPEAVVKDWIGHDPDLVRVGETLRQLNLVF